VAAEEDEEDPDLGRDPAPGLGHVTVGTVTEDPETGQGLALVDLAEAPNPAPGPNLDPDPARPRTRPTDTEATPLVTKGEVPDHAPEAVQDPGQRALKTTKCQQPSSGASSRKTLTSLKILFFQKVWRSYAQQLSNNTTAVRIFEE